MRYFAILLGLALFGGTATAEVISCEARVALNRTYNVELNTESGALQISTDNNYEFSGTASKMVSGRTGNLIFFLPVTFVDGFEIEVETAGQERIAMCLQPNECYLCRR